jgi:hypothetical protein
MPCPLFMPAEPFEPIDWLHPPRLPLGDAYRGTCHAQPDAPCEPPDSDQRDLCNCGYARGRCERLPPGAPDAIRFSITNDAGGTLRILWIIEKDHSPVEFGAIEYAEGKLSPASPLLTAQAIAFVRSHFDRASKHQSLLAGAGK